MLPPSLLPTPATRLVAQILDSLFAFACIAPGMLVFGIGVATDTTTTAVLGGVGMFVGVVVAVVVQIRLLRDGQTVGKRQMGIRIVHFPTLDLVTLGTSLGMRYVVGQAIIGAIPMIGPLYGLANVLFVFSEDHRCLHDRVASTVVVDDAAWQARRAGEFSGLFTDEPT